MGTPHRTHAFRAVLVAAVVLTASCSRTESLRESAIEGSIPIMFATPDGVELSGRLFGPRSSLTGIVLVHMLPSDQSAWYQTAASLGSQGYLVLTFDLRGYCPGGDAGCSEGEKDVDAAATDVKAAVDELRSRGVSTIGIAGASAGGTAALIVASLEGAGIEAVVTLSAPQAIQGLAAGPDVLQTVSAAKLFIGSTGDPSAAQAAEAFYNASIQPKRFEVVTSDGHGTDLLHGNQGTQVRTLIEQWFALHLGV